MLAEHRQTPSRALAARDVAKAKCVLRTHITHMPILPVYH